MVVVQKRTIRWAISLFLVILYFTGLPTQAQYGGGSGTTASAETNSYVFLPGQSTVVQTGGIAGVHETYGIEGEFQLRIDRDAGIASFEKVYANLTEPSSFLYTQSLGELFNMTSLLGTLLDDTTISFTGKAADGSDVLITLTIEDELAYLVGQTTPPPNTADFFLFSLDAVAQRQNGGGTGEPNEPYLIYTAEQMNEIGLHEEDWDKHFKLMADIDLSAYTGTSFNIIVSLYSSFRGVFDGNGKKISNFTYTSSDRDRVGLFGHVQGENALIKDLGLIDPNVDAGTSGMTYGGEYFGPLVGRLSEGTITGCYVEGGSVSGKGNVGALVGLNSNGTITNCYATGSVTGTGWRVGGLVGALSMEGTITNCYATGRVLGVENVGGLVGANWSGTISNCYSSGDVSGYSTVGGLVGDNFLDSTIANCYSSGDVSGDDIVGGLVGSYDPWGVGLGKITFSFWDTQTSGQATSGGGTGKTTAEMQTESTFTDAGWDFIGESVNGTEDIWSICEGTNYPRFVWQIPAGDFVCPDGITIDDFAFFTEYWLDDNCDISNDYCDGTDLDFSGTVDANDLKIFFENWLESSELEN